MQTTITTPNVSSGLHSRIRSTALRFRPGQLIFDEGQKAIRWYEVKRGTVRTCRFHIDGQRHLTGFYFAGDIFGAEYGCYSTAAEAVTDVLIQCYRVGDIAKEASPKPQLDEAVSILFRAMSSAQRYQFIMCHRTATERLSAFLLCLHQQGGNNPNIRLPMSRGDIADFLGLTIHTISRTFTDLARRGVIKVDGRHSVILIDKARLTQFAGECQDNLLPQGGARLHPAIEHCLGDRSAA